MHWLYACTDRIFIEYTILSDEASIIIIRIRPAAVSRHWNNCNAVEPPTPALALETHQEIQLELNTFYPNLNCIFFFISCSMVCGRFISSFLPSYFLATFLLFFGWRMCIQLLFLCALVCITLTATTVWAIPAMSAIRTSFTSSTVIICDLYGYTHTRALARKTFSAIPFFVGNYFDHFSFTFILAFYPNTFIQIFIHSFDIPKAFNSLFDLFEFY